MADHATHPTTVRGIDYKATFPFVHLFKAFRLSIDPSKLFLALVLLLLVYGGGRLLDACWPERHRAVTNELDIYAAEPVRFDVARNDRLAERDAIVKADLARLGHPQDPPEYDHHAAALRERRDTTIRVAHGIYDHLPVKTPESERQRDDAIRNAYALYGHDLTVAQSLRNEGLFIHFLMYEVRTFNMMVDHAIDRDVRAVVRDAVDFFFTAPAWAFREHGAFFSIFFAWLLVLWSVFGGALARISAVQVARDEKISVRQALRFSTGKVLSFLFAPLIPMIIVAFLGLLLAVVAIPISVPGVSGVWAVIVGAGFFVALLAGLVMMLTALGLVGGGHLMYPTIASEGSDSFDAVSRSFSYLYARPWQLGFYAFVSLLYGAVTYLVVRFALYVLLVLVHVSIGLFQWGHAADGTPIVEAMWPRPTDFMHLNFQTDYAALGPVQSVGAGILSFWVYLALSVLGAYVISLYVNSSTLIYFLLRRDVDATDLDEVYLEPADDELTEAAIAGEATLAPEAVSTPGGGPPEPTGQPVDLPAPPPPGV